jgi:hypothetical protein
VLPAKVAELDDAIMAQDRLLLRAVVQQVPESFQQRILAVRNQLTRDWGKEVGTKQVAS